MVPIRSFKPLKPDQLERVRGEVGGLTSLHDVLRWAFALSPPLEVANVVVQDEYTHDIVINRAEDLYLCFDTT